jgi:hypothetical protein
VFSVPFAEDHIAAASRLNQATRHWHTATLAVKSPLAPLCQRGVLKSPPLAKGAAPSAGGFCSALCQAPVVRFSTSSNVITCPTTLFYAQACHWTTPLPAKGGAAGTQFCHPCNFHRQPSTRRTYCGWSYSLINVDIPQTGVTIRTGRKERSPNELQPTLTRSAE